MAEAYELVLLRVGATLLTPWERLLYLLSIITLAVIVSIGVSKASSFYVHNIQALFEH